MVLLELRRGKRTHLITPWTGGSYCGLPPRDGSTIKSLPGTFDPSFVTCHHCARHAVRRATGIDPPFINYAPFKRK